MSLLAVLITLNLKNVEQAENVGAISYILCDPKLCNLVKISSLDFTVSIHNEGFVMIPPVGNRQDDKEKVVLKLASCSVMMCCFSFWHSRSCFPSNYRRIPGHDIDTALEETAGSSGLLTHGLYRYILLNERSKERRSLLLCRDYHLRLKGRFHNDK